MKTPRFQCKQPGGRERKKFPDVLYEILSDPRNYHIIYWMPHGRSWRVHDREKLAKVLCPRYFNHCKFESFTRSATGWGFKRVVEDGPEYNCYYHKNFLRGRPELIPLILRLDSSGKKSKGNGAGSEGENTDGEAHAEEDEQGNSDNPSRGQTPFRLKSESSEDASNNSPRHRPQQHWTYSPQFKSDPDGDDSLVDFNQSLVDHDDGDKHNIASSSNSPHSGYIKFNYKSYQDNYQYENQLPPQRPPSHTLSPYHPPLPNSNTKNPRTYFDHSHNRHQLHAYPYPSHNSPSQTNECHRPRQFENPRREQVRHSQTQPYHQHEHNYYNPYNQHPQRYEYHRQYHEHHNYNPPYFQQTLQQKECQPYFFRNAQHQQNHAHRNNDHTESPRLETEMRHKGKGCHNPDSYSRSYSAARARPLTQRLSKKITKDLFIPQVSSTTSLHGNIASNRLETIRGNGTSLWNNNGKTQVLDDERKQPAQQLGIEHADRPHPAKRPTRLEQANKAARESREVATLGSETAMSLDHLAYSDELSLQPDHLLAFEPPAASIRKKPPHEETLLSASVANMSPSVSSRSTAGRNGSKETIRRRSR